MHITLEGQAFKSGLNIGWGRGAKSKWYNFWVRFVHVSIDMSNYSSVHHYLRFCTYRLPIFNKTIHKDLIESHLLMRNLRTVTQEFLEDLKELSIAPGKQPYKRGVGYALNELLKLGY